MPKSFTATQPERRTERRSGRSMGLMISSSRTAREERATAQRDLVADLEALGEPEPLELAHVRFERDRVAPELLRELRRRDARMAIDQRERAARPFALCI